jgi:hypothetical protein
MHILICDDQYLTDLIFPPVFWFTVVVCMADITMLLSGRLSLISGMFTCLNCSFSCELLAIVNIFDENLGPCTVFIECYCASSLTRTYMTNYSSGTEEYTLSFQTQITNLFSKFYLSER